MKLCPNCGTEIKKGKKICPNCKLEINKKEEQVKSSIDDTINNKNNMDEEEQVVVEYKNESVIDIAEKFPESEKDEFDYEKRKTKSIPLETKKVKEIKDDDILEVEKINKKLKEIELRKNKSNKMFGYIYYILITILVTVIIISIAQLYTPNKYSQSDIRNLRYISDIEWR